MIILLYALATAYLPTAHAATPLETLTPEVAQVYKRFAACQKITDEDRETTCLRQLEKDAYAMYKAPLNQFILRTSPLLNADQRQLVSAMAAGQSDYVMNHCRGAELASGPNLVAMRRNHARCVIRTQAESAYALLVFESGTLINPVPAAREAIRSDVATQLKDLYDRAQACQKLPVPTERDACVTRTSAEVTAYAQPAFAAVAAAQSKKPGAVKLRPAFDGAQVGWSTFAKGLCRTTADLRPGGAAATNTFYEACLTRVTLARVREVYRDL